MSVLDISLMQDFLHWKPRLSFADGIRRTLSDLEKGNAFSTMS